MSVRIVPNIKICRKSVVQVKLDYGNFVKIYLIKKNIFGHDDADYT